MNRARKIIITTVVNVYFFLSESFKSEYIIWRYIDVMTGAKAEAGNLSCAF